MPNLKDARYCSRSFYLRPILASQFHILFITAQRRSKRPGPLGRDSDITWAAVTKARDLDILTEYQAKDSTATGLGWLYRDRPWLATLQFNRRLLALAVTSSEGHAG